MGSVVWWMSLWRWWDTVGRHVCRSMLWTPASLYLAFGQYWWTKDFRQTHRSGVRCSAYNVILNMWLWRGTSAPEMFNYWLWVSILVFFWGSLPVLPASAAYDVIATVVARQRTQHECIHDSGLNLKISTLPCVYFQLHWSNIIDLCGLIKNYSFQFYLIQFSVVLETGSSSQVASLHLVFLINTEKLLDVWDFTRFQSNSSISECL